MSINTHEGNRFRIVLILMICMILVLSAGLCNCYLQASEERINSRPKRLSSRDWMREEKIKAGYLYFYNDKSHLKEIKSSGLNTLIVKAWQFDEKQEAKSLFLMRSWGGACQANGMHMIAAYNWQPQKECFRYRSAVFKDGTNAMFSCPLDKEFWKGHILKIGRDLSRISTEDDMSLDAVMLDLEIYGTEYQPTPNKYYTDTTCYCGNCFSSFFKTMKDSILIPDVEARDRYQYLKKNGLLEAYRAFLEASVAEFAVEYRNEIRSINPEISFGLYPYSKTKNWVLQTMARVLGSNDRPVLLFSVDTYYKGGHASIPRNPQSVLREERIDGLYIPGYLFRKYPASMVHENIVYSRMKSDGYFLFKLPQLWSKSLNSSEMLAEGSTQDYWKAISTANGMKSDVVE